MVIWVVLQDNKDARHVKTYEVSLKDKDFIEGPWSQNNLDNGADLLIPVPPPLCGVIIVGEETIVYCSATAFKAIPIRPVSFIGHAQSLCFFAPSKDKAKSILFYHLGKKELQFS